MSLGVRREVVLSRWEIQVTSLRAECPQPPAWPPKTHRGAPEAILAGSFGCVATRPFEFFVLCRVLGGGRPQAWVPCGWAEEGSESKITSFRGRVLPMEDPHLGGLVMPGPMWEDQQTPDGVGAGLPFLCEGGVRLPGRLRRNMGDRIVSEVAVSDHTEGHCEGEVQVKER